MASSPSQETTIRFLSLRGHHHRASWGQMSSQSCILLATRRVEGSVGSFGKGASQCHSAVARIDVTRNHSLNTENCPNLKICHGFSQKSYTRLHGPTISFPTPQNVPLLPPHLPRRRNRGSSQPRSKILPRGNLSQASALNEHRQLRRHFR